MTRTLATLGLVAALGYLVAACGGSSGSSSPPPRPVRLLATTVPPNSKLVELDPTTGELVRTIGTVGYGVNGLQYVAASATLFATTTDWDARFPRGLLSIDPATADATLIGTSAGEIVAELAANHAGQLYTWDVDWRGLARIDPTGVTTLGPRFALGGAWAFGLAADARDRLFLFNHDGEVMLVDWTTGVTSTAGHVATMAHHGDFHPTTGRYWGLTSQSNPRAFLIANVDAVGATTLDPVTATTVRAPNDVHAITFVR